MLPRSLHIANEGRRSCIEMVMLAAPGLVGGQVGRTAIARVALGVGVPLAAAIFWGLIAAPKARIRLPVAGVLSVKALALSAAAAAAIHSLGRPWLAIGFAVVALINAAIAAADRNARAR